MNLDHLKEWITKFQTTRLTHTQQQGLQAFHLNLETSKYLVQHLPLSSWSLYVPFCRVSATLYGPSQLGASFPSWHFLASPTFLHTKYTFRSARVLTQKLYRRVALSLAAFSLTTHLPWSHEEGLGRPLGCPSYAPLRSFLFAMKPHPPRLGSLRLPRK